MAVSAADAVRMRPISRNPIPFMKTLLLAFSLVFAVQAAADPLRVFIRSGPKTHGPGAHDHPAFLRDWTALLNERGADAKGGDEFPTKEQLEQTDVLILNAPDAGNIHGEQRANLEAFVKRGGGVVAIHAGTVSDDPDWFKTIVGGSWRHNQTRWLEGDMSLYFTDIENEITRDVSNFDLDDEIYYDFDLQPDIRVLAAAFTPKARGKLADVVTIYDIQPQIWTYETADHRAFVHIPGHLYRNFSHNSVRTVLLRGIAWAGKLDDVDAFTKPQERGDALRYPEGGPTRPEEAASKIEIHPEFDLALVAAEPLINKPMNIDWDPQGRLWVAETPEYPNGLRKANTEIWKESGSLSPGNYDRDPLDRISILTDTNGDGVMDKKHVFADKLELITSFVFHKNGVIVCAAPDIWFLEDTTGDEVADKRTKLYSGLGAGDTHAVINNLRWGLDGWVYATHGYSAGNVTALHGADGKPQAPVRIGSGVVRFKPDGSRIEQFASRGGNTWGLDMTWDGQCFWTQPTSGTVFFHTVLPEPILAKGKMPGINSWHGMVSRQRTFPLMRWEQQAYVQIDQVGSFTAAAGCAVYEGGAWPERWNYSYFTTEPTINIVSHFFVKPNGVTFATHKEAGREETEFIRSRDLWFCPIETRVGPDGALYVIDFYNQAVIHNDTRGPQHGPANAAVRPDRDHYFGRIWRIQHKQAKAWEIPLLDPSDNAGLLKIIDEHPNAHLKHNAWRLLNEAGAAGPIADRITAKIGSSVERAYRSMQNPDTTEKRSALFKTFATADNDWTRSAVIAAASEFPEATITEALASPLAAKLEPVVNELLPTAIEPNRGDTAGRLLIAAAKAPESASALKTIILRGLSARPAIKPTINQELAASFTTLLNDPATAAQTLPIIAAWDTEGKMKEEIAKQTAGLSKTLADGTASDEVRINAAASLIRLGSDEALDSVTAIFIGEDSPSLRNAVLAALGESEHAARIVPVFAQLGSSLKSAAFDQIVKRPDASLAFLNSVEEGKINPSDIGPGNIARLRTHPDRTVANRAEALLDKLLPGAQERAELIARLIPEVSRPGNAENGRTLYAAACAVCHKLGDLGQHDVGPPLDGMGSHGVAELLTHIIDPNREVDPSFWQWNITTNDGATFAGVIVSENPATITLRNQGGDFSIRKGDIAARENTHRSLMPEGLEGLGAEGLRDILTFMAGDASPYRVLDLRGAYTADARRGLFARAEATVDSVFPAKYGNQTIEKIPFFLMDPAASADGKSLIVLRGGGRGMVAQRHPRRVEIPADATASHIHLLSGIAGWGYPSTDDERPALKVTITRADGGSEVVELLNARHFADYNREIDVPDSKLLKGVVRSGQLRLITIPLKEPGNITGLTLESYDNGVTPVVMAITTEDKR
jgi:putative membrane-bound dehydrogenase-like protein